MRDILNFLWPIIKPYKWWYALMLQAPFLGGLHHVMGHYAVKLIIDRIVKFDVLVVTSFIFPVCLYLASEVYVNVLWRLHNFASWRCEPYVRRDILTRTSAYVFGHSYRFFQNTQTGTIVSRVKGIIDGYDHLLGSILHVIGPAAGVCVLTIIPIAFVSADLFMLIAVWCVVSTVIIVRFAKTLAALQTAETEAKHRIIGLIGDCVGNIFSLFAFATRKIEVLGVRGALNKDFIPKEIAVYKYHFKMQIICGILFLMVVGTTLPYLIHLRYLNKISIGDVVFVLSLMYSFLEQYWNALMGVQDFIKNMGEFKSSFAIMTTPQGTVDKPNAKNLVLKQHGVEFRNIDFAYESGHQVMQNFELKIKHNEKVGLIGVSGSGKSTLMSLLLKNFAVKSGDVLVGGTSIYDVTSDSLRSNIALIPQDIMLFHRTIMENIRYGNPDATDEEVHAAARIANIHKFIKALPHGYNEYVGERGVKLSGGQRQRIAIARAVLKNAPILILDEATSALDTESEQEIQKSINKMLAKKDITVIAIAHRLSTLKHMDRLIVLSKGKIVEEGTHYQLIRNKTGLYSKLWNMQRI